MGGPPGSACRGRLSRRPPTAGSKEVRLTPGAAGSPPLALRPVSSSQVAPTPHSRVCRDARLAHAPGRRRRPHHCRCRRHTASAVAEALRKRGMRHPGGWAQRPWRPPHAAHHAALPPPSFPPFPPSARPALPDAYLLSSLISWGGDVCSPRLRRRGGGCPLAVTEGCAVLSLHLPLPTRLPNPLLCFRHAAAAGAGDDHQQRPQTYPPFPTRPSVAGRAVSPDRKSVV